VVNADLEAAVAEVRTLAAGEGQGRSPFTESARIDALRKDLAGALRERMEADEARRRAEADQEAVSTAEGEGAASEVETS